MNDEIIFEWDEEKRFANFVKHGVDFTEAMFVFKDPKVSVVPDDRKEYGESRFNAYGLSNGQRLRVCFTLRGQNIIRVISMFKIHKKEWGKFYGNS